jgi:hypothetical protein
MKRRRPTLSLLAAFALLVLVELLVAGCSTTINGKPVWARVGQRMPGVVTHEADGDVVRHEGLDAGQQGVMLIFRGAF